MEKITYGAPRLVDWVAQIKAGTATVRVHFTGGALTQYGVTPAEYTTQNAFIQRVIEQSSYFKEGRIVLLRRTAIAEAAKPSKAAKPKEKATPKPLPTPAEGATDTSEGEVPQQTPEVRRELSERGTDGGGLTIVEASCLQDAQAYLQENFNISSYKVRTYEAAQRAASEHGVLFVGSKFDNAESGEAAVDESMREEE